MQANIYDPSFYAPPSPSQLAQALQVIRAARLGNGRQSVRRAGVPNMFTANPASNGSYQLQGYPTSAPLDIPPPSGPCVPPPPVGTPDGNGGGVCGCGATPELLRWVMQVYGPDALARVVWATRGGTVGQGYPCAPQPLPELPRDADGCKVGWQQCKLPLPVNALQVDPGETVDIVVSPPYDAVADSFMYIGPTQTFTVDNVRIGLTDYIQGPIAADTWNASVNGADYSVQFAPFSSSTPLIMSVTNVSGFIATFRGTMQVRANRMGG